MAQMTYSKSGINLIESFESCRLTSYQDSKGVWTIGYGHTGPDVKPGMTCIPTQAEQWLETDINWAEYVVNHNIYVSMTQDEFDALVDFVFNVGSGNFLGSGLLRLINAGLYRQAAAQFDLWDHSAGKVVAGLLRRRQAETNLFEEDL
jgi:lysozyme